MLALTTEQLADETGFSREKIGWLVAEGALKCIDNGNGRLFPVTLVQAFLKDYAELGLSTANRQSIRESEKIRRRLCQKKQ